MAVVLLLAAALVSVLSLSGCGKAADKPSQAAAPAAEPVTIMVAAAASLEKAYVEQLIPAFQKLHPSIKVQGTYDSSGKLQTQIESGLNADVFMSAATKQMDALTKSGFISADSVLNLLENKIVLIKPASSKDSSIASFEDVLKAETIAVGDPESVPAGQYAREVFTSLGLWDKVRAKSTLGTNVTQVLNWVAEGSAGVGVVYATDAASNKKVTVIAEAPKGSLKTKIVYPVGILAKSSHPKEARLFVDFLRSKDALAVFEKYGFSPN